jgi:hypothetical protein
VVLPPPRLILKGEKMTKNRAIVEATKTAIDNGIDMVVTYNPYSENPYEDSYGYYPLASKSIFINEESIISIDSKGVVISE